MWFGVHAQTFSRVSQTKPGALHALHSKVPWALTQVLNNINLEEMKNGNGTEEEKQFMLCC